MSILQNEVICERLWEEAVETINTAMANNPTIPEEAREQLIIEEFTNLLAYTERDVETEMDDGGEE